LRNIVDRFAERSFAFIGSVMGVAVDDRLDMIEAVDGLA